MKNTVEFTKEELGAIKTVASIGCVGINCSGCPLNLSNIPNNTGIWGERGCFRNIAIDIVDRQEEEKL